MSFPDRHRVSFSLTLSLSWRHMSFPDIIYRHLHILPMNPLSPCRADHDSLCLSLSSSERFCAHLPSQPFSLSLSQQDNESLSARHAAPRAAHIGLLSLPQNFSTHRRSATNLRRSLSAYLTPPDDLCQEFTKTRES
ncbi:hypothetical protein KP509_11G062800 [Ceratopteris richardii]|uniref:Uncharacterized protein n=1 Tax=Ceratopteris richardii TaxID=49495 RepID=A0A8T2TQ07_CERRI|nr:hypothetical protein KP509_11G062800 [Ceratopteris richardii]